MTRDECRAEALKRVQAADDLFEEVAAKSAHPSDPTHRRIAHLRQTAQVYALLALTPAG